MKRTTGTAALVTIAFVYSLAASAGSISGQVLDASGNPFEGVMVSAFDGERAVSASVFSQADGGFVIDGLHDATFNVRARLLGQVDEWSTDVAPGTTDLSLTLAPATGEELESQRTGDSTFSMIDWESERDKRNFKMMCAYCHQIGTVGFRSPEQPVDWETMVRRMDGFGGLYDHTQESLVERLLSAYSEEAVAAWPDFVPPAAPTGAATQAKMTEWDMGWQDDASIHDIELGDDGLVYAVDLRANGIRTLDPKTGERKLYTLTKPKSGPHSIERDNDGNMWITLCLSGEMAKFDVKTREFTVTSSAPAPARRGTYPHTLRINPADPEGLVWYTDAGSNAVYAMHPKTLEVTRYRLLSKDQAVGAGKGESRGITPYGIDYSPVDGSIWYSKLNANRIGRIDPNVEGGDIKEWNPPFRGPRRLHVAPDGKVWVPGFASGVIGSFDPNTEEWEVFELRNAENRIPYALNVDREGIVWICGTGNDTLIRFDPQTEEMTEIRMPSRVTYTREIEFGDDGSVWTCNSNSPVRHTERGFGSIIKLEMNRGD